MNKVSHIVRPKTLETPTILTQRFDGSGRGELSDREAFNVLKMQHKVNISQEKVNIQLQFWVSLFATNNFDAN